VANAARGREVSYEKKFGGKSGEGMSLSPAPTLDVSVNVNREFLQRRITKHLYTANECV